jgi:hypothetical protein
MSSAPSTAAARRGLVSSFKHKPSQQFQAPGAVGSLVKSIFFGLLLAPDSASGRLFVSMCRVAATPAARHRFWLMADYDYLPVS